MLGLLMKFFRFSLLTRFEYRYFLVWFGPGIVLRTWFRWELVVLGLLNRDIGCTNFVVFFPWDNLVGLGDLTFLNRAILLLLDAGKRTNLFREGRLECGGVFDVFDDLPVGTLLSREQLIGLYFENLDSEPKLPSDSELLLWWQTFVAFVLLLPAGIGALYLWELHAVILMIWINCSFAISVYKINSLLD